MATPAVRQIVAAHRVSIREHIRRVHRQGQFIDTVALVLRLQAVPDDVRASLRRDCYVGVAFPNVRLIVARRSLGFSVEGRVHQQRQHINAVAMVHRFQAIPDCVEAGLRRDGHIGMAFPNIRFIITGHSLFRNKIGRVHRQIQRAHAVAAMDRRQRVHQRVMTGLCRDHHIRVVIPYVWHIVTRFGILSHRIRRMHGQSQVHDAVTSCCLLKHHSILTRLRKEAVAIMERQFAIANDLFIIAGRVRIHHKGYNDCAVAGVHRSVMDGIVSSLVQSHISIINIRKFVGT